MPVMRHADGRRFTMEEGFALQQATYERRLRRMRTERAYEKIAPLVALALSQRRRRGSVGALLGWRKLLRKHRVDLVW